MKGVQTEFPPPPRRVTGGVVAGTVPPPPHARRGGAVGQGGIGGLDAGPRLPVRPPTDLLGDGDEGVLKGWEVLKPS
jgi:hypothetical protein